MSTSLTIERRAIPAGLPQLAERANYHHEQCTAAATNALDHARAAGDTLIEMKRRSPHGSFAAILHQHFHGAPRTARLYMQVARRWPEIEAQRQNGNGVATLGLREAARLTGPGTSTPTATSMPVEADYPNFMDYYVAWMKAWWNDIEERLRRCREDSILALKKRLASYTRVEQVLTDHEPPGLIRRRHRLEREEAEWHHIADEIVRIATEKLAELEAEQAGGHAA